jgi:hypothetical protein
MRRLLFVVRRDLKDMLATTAFRIMVLIVAFITVAASVIIPVALHLQSWYGVQEAEPVLAMITGLIIYFFSLFVLLAFVWRLLLLPLQ